MVLLVCCSLLFVRLNNLINRNAKLTKNVDVFHNTAEAVSQEDKNGKKVPSVQHLSVRRHLQGNLSKEKFIINQIFQNRIPIEKENLYLTHLVRCDVILNKTFF